MDKIFNISTAVFTAFQFAIIWALVAHADGKKVQKIISVILCVFLAMAFVVTNPSDAYAEEGRLGIVVIVYYSTDTYILEWEDGERDLFDGRGDLMPGDKLLVWGPEYEDMELIEQSNWNFFDYLINGEPVASFLYPEDAKEVMEEAIRGFPIFLFHGHYNSGVVQPQKEVSNMKLGWHCVRDYWFYGTSTSKIETPKTSRPDGIVMYTEGPCAAIQTQLRTGTADEYKAEKNFNVPFEIVVSEIDATLEKGTEVPAVVVREDDGQLENMIVDGYVIDTGYLSTTNSSKYIGTHRAVRYRITGLIPGCGRDVSEFSQYNHEKEFLFRRNSKFKVTGKRKFEQIGQEGTEYFLEYIGIEANAQPQKKQFVPKPIFDKCIMCHGIYKKGTEVYDDDGWLCCPLCGSN